MTIRLRRFVSRGPGKPDAEIVLDRDACLIRGPSDTGKSYIRECLRYMLGAEKPPKSVPEAAGYDTFLLEFSSGGGEYAITRALAGGSAEIRRTNVGEQSELVEADLGELLVTLSGAGGKQILRSRSKKGAITGGDLRHWFLLSQTDVISEHPTTGASHADRFQRAAAFYVYLTGLDDTAFVLALSQSQKDSISGQILAAEDAIKRAQAGIPPSTTKQEVLDALDKVDQALNEITRQYQQRAEQLKGLRGHLTDVAVELQKVQTLRMHSQSMVQRFELLDEKYDSDLRRLGAIDEGTAYFESLKPVPCVLCGTPLEKQMDKRDLRADAAESYRAAVKAEAQKIRALRVGLKDSLQHEMQRFEESRARELELRTSLDDLERRERRAIAGLRVEFSSDPKELAVRRSDLSSQLNLFEDIERCQAEIARLKVSRSTKAAPLTREAHEAATAVASTARDLLRRWGFADVNEVQLSTEDCDLVINGRPRLSYGAGRRGVFLTALAVALLQHALGHSHPHIGFCLIDSPLKTYADPDKAEHTDENGVADVPLATVRDGFFSWLSTWTGPGQLIVLENEKVADASIAATLRPIVFTGPGGGGRPGFYPASIAATEQSSKGAGGDGGSMPGEASAARGDADFPPPKPS